MKMWQKNLGSSLTATSLAVLGLSATLTPLGVSKTVLIIIAASGGGLGVAGVFFSHLWAANASAAIDAGAAIDADAKPYNPYTPPAAPPKP